MVRWRLECGGATLPAPDASPAAPPRPAPLARPRRRPGGRAREPAARRRRRPGRAGSRSTPGARRCSPTRARTAGPRHVLVWGAINARTPDSRPAAGPLLARLHGRPAAAAARPSGSASATPAAATTAPSSATSSPAARRRDGSYWALQRWQRNLPIRGLAAVDAWQRAYELRLSHWVGPLAQVESTRTGRSRRRAGHLRPHDIRGKPVHGFHTPSTASRRDTYGRCRLHRHARLGIRAGLEARRRQGAPSQERRLLLQLRPPGAAARLPDDRAPRGPGNGDRHRVTAMGPGVTPVDPLGGRGSRPLRRARATRTTTRSSTGSSGADDAVCTPER